MEKYFIAYSTNICINFEELPLIVGEFSSINDAKSFIADCGSNMMRNPAIFSTPDNLMEEELTWEYVYAHLSCEDLCKSCSHYYRRDVAVYYEAHCDILDRMGKLLSQSAVPYPCLKCPFDSYIPKTNLKEIKYQDNFFGGSWVF